MIKGISIERDGSATVCRIDEFSPELKSEIRKRLASICHGPDAVTNKAVFASYKHTLKEFNKRYKPKSENIKKGMIGELLTHILLLHAQKILKPAMPFFNMEESSVKKGFDLIIFDSKLNALRITEVKSGNAGKDSADNVNRKLLNAAKNDLKKRLNASKTNLWLNAIHGAKIALSKGKVKDRINEILEECYQEADEDEQDSCSKNVILVSITYKATSDPITIHSVAQKRAKIAKESLFNDTTVFSIQKKTYQAIGKFLSDESKK